jgi:DeoR/GlpR family transcriptional regulator of sugar metabolism
MRSSEQESPAAGVGRAGSAGAHAVRPMRQARGMLVPDRRRLLLAELRRRGSAQIEQLADVLGVSASTVRRDLALLESDGQLLRAHGGAYVTEPVSPAVAPAPGRAGSRPAPPAGPPADDAKARIGAAAAARVEDGMTIMILGGSTTAQLLPHLAHRPITVVTNGLEIAQALAHSEVELVMLGGVLSRPQLNFLGPLTAQNMADLHVDVMFAGAWGVSAEAGVTGNKVIVAGYHHSMLRHTDDLVVLADGAKYGRQGPTLLAEVGDVGHFVTDRDAPEPVVAALRDRGADVTVC